MAPPGYPKTCFTPSRSRHSQRMPAPVMVVLSLLMVGVSFRSVINLPTSRRCKSSPGKPVEQKCLEYSPGGATASHSSSPGTGYRNFVSGPALIPNKNKTRRAIWRVGFESTCDFQFLSSPFPPHRVGLAYSSPRNSKTNSQQAPSIRHGCTKALKDTTRPTVRLASAKPDCRVPHPLPHFNSRGCPALVAFFATGRG